MGRYKILEFALLGYLVCAIVACGVAALLGWMWFVGVLA